MREPTDESEEGEITQLLVAWSRGDLRALDKIFPLAFQDLRHIARRCHRKIPSADLEPTELIGEIYSILLKQNRVHWECRGQFYKFAAFLMERVLLGYRRTLRTEKRGGDLVRVPLIEALDLAPDGDTTSLSGSASEDQRHGDSEVLEALAQAVDVAEKISELGKLDPHQAEIAKLRYFIGLSIEETAEALGVSQRTVTRKWKNAKRFLSLELDGYGAD